MNKSTVILASALSAAACSTPVLATANVDNFSNTGPYAVLQMGGGQVNTGFLDNLFGATELQHNHGFAGRLGMGYQFNRYLSIESGLSHYPSAIRNYDSNRGLLPVAGFIGNSKISDIYSIDLMGAFRMPIGQRFFIGAQLGGAAIHFNYAAMNATNGAASVLSWNPSSAWFIAPKVGLKLGMALNPSTSVFASSSYIYSVNGNNPEIRDYQPGLSMYSAGINYSF